VIKRLNLELEGARTNANARTNGTSYAKVVKGAPLGHPPPLPPPQPLPVPEDDLERRQAVNSFFTLYESQHVQMMKIRDLPPKLVKTSRWIGPTSAGILDYITAGIVSALDTIASEKEIRVKKGQNLYLTRETLEAMRMRDSATGKRYCTLRNEVSRLVRRDKQDSNLLSLKKASNGPKVFWHLADQALGKDHPRPSPVQTAPRLPPWRRPT
jgi:hypothetical protein